jgi:hypothetical protein
MFNDEESRRRSQQLHDELVRQQRVQREAAVQAQQRQRPPAQVRRELNDYRRRATDPKR